MEQDFEVLTGTSRLYTNGGWVEDGDLTIDQCSTSGLPVQVFKVTGPSSPEGTSGLSFLAVEEFTFQKRLEWYAKITYTDPWRHGWLVGEVTANDFLFAGIEKWGSGLSGWGVSLAAVYGQRVVANTTELFVGELIGDDARYRRSGKKGVRKRAWYATTHAFTAQARSGNTRPAYSRCIAVTTGALVANQWLPHPETGAELTRTLIFGITDKIQDDILEEFSPDLKRFGRKIWRKLHR